MPDTIRLKFPVIDGAFLIVNNQFFKDKISVRDLGSIIDRQTGRHVYTNKQFREDRKAKKLYTPKYWLEEDYLDPKMFSLVIEFSVLKLLYGESLSTFDDFNLEKLISALVNFLKEINFPIFTIQIRKAVPIVLSVGKNIVMTKLCSSELAIQALSPFDDRFRSLKNMRMTMNHTENGGHEIYFSNTLSSFKVYDKTREVANNWVTEKEEKISLAFTNKGYKSISDLLVPEVLRFELTLRNKQSVRQRLKPFLNGAEPTLENIFNTDIWHHLLIPEVEKIYNHPLKNFIYLSLLSKPAIEDFLDRNYKASKVNAEILLLLIYFQEKGLRETKIYFFNKYDSRQTWYNYLDRIKEMEKAINMSDLKNITSIGILNFIFKEFGIETMKQDTLF